MNCTLSFLIGFLSVFLIYFGYNNLQTDFHISKFKLFIGFRNIFKHNTYSYKFGVNIFSHVYDSLEDYFGYQILNKTQLNVSFVKLKNVEFIVYEPLEGKFRKPLIIYIHGGGWLYHSASSYSNLTGELALELSSTVISLNYRKAPDYPFPLPYNDCLEATKYIKNNLNIWNVDEERISVMGDSAGGNLALAVAVELNKLQLFKIQKLILLSPTLQMFDMKTKSMLENNNDMIISRNNVLMAYCLYAGGLKTDLSSCMNTLSKNEHVDVEIMTEIGGRMFIGDINDTEAIAEFNSKFPASNKAPVNSGTQENIVNWPVLLRNPNFSPLSALSDTDLLTYFNNTKFIIQYSSHDPLRDDSMILNHRLDKVFGVNKNHVLIGLNYSHDPLALLPFGNPMARKTMDLLKEALE